MLLRGVLKWFSLAHIYVQLHGLLNVVIEGLYRIQLHLDLIQFDVSK